MSVISSLKVLLTADTIQFRKALAKTGSDLREFASSFGSLAKMGEDFAKLGATGVGETFRAPDSGQFISASQAMEYYFDRVNRVYDALGNLRVQLEENNGALNRTSIANIAMAQSAARAVRDNQILASSTALIVPRANVAATAMQKMRVSLRSVVASATDASAGLNYFGLANYNVRQSVESWNWASVIKGPGSLIGIYDKLRFVLFGIVPPMRLIQKVVISLLVPALMAIKEALDRSGSSGGRFTKLLGDNLEKAAFDIQNLGQSYKRTLGTGLQAAFQIAAGLSAKWANSTVNDVNRTIAAFQRISGAVTQTANSIRAAVPNWQALGAAATSSLPRLKAAIPTWQSLSNGAKSFIPYAQSAATSLLNFGNSIRQVILVRGILASLVGVAASTAMSLASVGASALLAGKSSVTAAAGLGAIGASMAKAAATVIGVISSFTALSVATIGVVPTILAVITAVGGTAAAFTSVRAAAAATLNLLTRLAAGFASLAASAVKAAAVQALRSAWAALQSAGSALIGVLTRLPGLMARMAASAGRAAANVLTLGRAFRKSASDAGVAANAIQKTNAAARGGGRAMQGLVFGLSSMGPGIGIMASMGPVAAASFGLVAAAAEGIKQAANFEQVNVAFTTMLKDADLAKKTLGQLQQFADVTPFDTTETINAGKALLAFGFTADELIPTLSRVGDVAAGVGVDFGELATLFGQFKAQSKIMTQDLRQLTSRGIPILEELAKQFGVPTEKIFEMAEAGQIGFEHIDYAFKSMTASGGQFASLMAKQSQTVGGLWSTLTSTIIIAVRDVGTAIIEGLNIRAGLAGLISVAQWITSTGVPLFSKGLTTIAGLIGEYVTPAFEFMASVIYENVDAAQGFLSASFTTISEIVTTAVGYVVTAVQTGWGWVAGFIQQTFGVNVTSVFTNFSESVSYAFILAEYVMKNWQTVVELAVASALLSIVTWANNVQYFLTEAVPQYLSWFGRNWKNIFLDIFNGTVAIFSNLGTNLKNFFTEFWNFIKSGGTSAFNFTWQPLLDGFKATTEQLPTIAAREMTDVEKNLQGQVNGLAGQLVSGFDSFYQQKQDELAKQKEKRKQEENAPPAEPPKPPDALGAPPPPREEKDKKKKKDKSNDGLEALVVGSSSALKAMANNRAGLSDKQLAKESLKEQRNGTKVLKDIHKAINNPKLVEFQIGGA